MISKEHKIIFIHIPKTGGTSIESAFGKTRSHERREDIIKEHGISVWDEYFKFSIVRNPWDRMLSMYHFRRTFESDASEIGFKEWLFEKRHEDNPYIRSQLNWVRDSSGIHVDYIGRFERLKYEFSKIAPSLTLPHKNKTEHKHFTHYYDRESMELVLEWQKEDVEHFNYKFLLI